MEQTELFPTLISLVSELSTLELQLSGGLELGAVTPLQLRALQILHFGGKITLSALGGCLGLSLPNASREIRKLTGWGLVNKSGDPQDRRLVLLELSPAGRALVIQTFATLEKNFASLSRGWSSQRMEVVATSAQLLLGALKGEP